MTPHLKVDAYGQPLSTPVDARQEPLYDTATNAEQRAQLWAALEELLRTVCVRGWYGEIGITVSIQDGTMKETTVERVRRRR